MKALALLEWRRWVNALKRIARSPGLLVLYALTLTGMAVFLLRGMAGGAPAPGRGLSMPVEAIAAGYVGTSLLVGTYAATRTAPWAFEAADGTWLFVTPVPPATVALWQLVRRAVTGFLSSLPMVVLIAALAAGSGEARVYGVRFVLLAAALTLAGTWSAGIQAVVWLFAVGPGPEEAARRAGRIRSAVVVVGAVAAAWLLQPVFEVLAGADVPGEFGQAARAALEPALQRLEAAGRIPPFSWLASLVRPSVAPELDPGVVGAALAGSVSVTALLIFVACLLARDYYEPALQAVSRQADVMRSVQETKGAEVSGVAAQWLGIRRATVRVPPFGRGPWALLWAQTLRCLRIELASLKVVIPLMIVLGAVIGLLVRRAGVPLWGALVLPGLAALAGGGSYFLEELRRPYLFTIPGAQWKRLFAASAVPWFDGALSLTLMHGVAMAVGGVPLAPALAAWVYLLTLMAASQAGAMVAFTWLPGWAGTMAREGLRFYLAGAAMLPGLVPVAWAAFASQGLASAAWVAGFATASAANLAAAAALFALAVRRFGRLEML